MIRLIGLAFALALGWSAARAGDAFTFLAFGDAPYGLPGDESRFKLLTDQANRLKPAFVVHIGDIKSGHSSCGDPMFFYIRDLFARFEGPLIYTPGDNEWTDCHRILAGQFNPVERLQRLRQIFFTDSYSLGRTRLKLTRQSEDPAFAAYVENAMWDAPGIQFATVHVVGSGNNFHHHLPDRSEYIARNAANLAWLDRVFGRATGTGARTVVLFMHADPLFQVDDDRRVGFADTIEAFGRHAQAFARPVLLIHGDTHEYKIDQPLRADPIARPGARPGARTGARTGARLRNFTRLEVFGSPETRGVIVTVAPDAPEPFTFKPMIFPYDIPPGTTRP